MLDAGSRASRGAWSACCCKQWVREAGPEGESPVAGRLNLLTTQGWLQAQRRCQLAAVCGRKADQTLAILLTRPTGRSA